jgi:hypothetical protein
MASSPSSPVPQGPRNASLAKIDEIVKRFLSDAEQHGFPVFLICSAYQELDGSWRFRTRVDGNSTEIIGALEALLTMLTTDDFEALMLKVITEHPEIARFRQLHGMPTNGTIQ